MDREVPAPVKPLNLTMPPMAFGAPVQGGMVATTLQDFELIAKLAVQSKWFKDVDDVAKGVIKMMLGAELGMSPMESLNGIYVYNGRAALYAESIAERMIRGGADVRVIELTKERCELALFDDNAEVGRVHYTYAQAQDAGYPNRPGPGGSKNPWQVDPESMLYARCVTRLHKRYGRRYFNKVVQSVEEMQDVQYIDAQDKGVQILAQAGAVRKARESQPKDKAVTAAQEKLAKAKEAAAQQPAPAPEPIIEAIVEHVKDVKALELPQAYPDKAMTQELTEAGKQNGWSQEQIALWACKKFGFETHEFKQSFTVAYWEATLAWVKAKKPGEE